jgi:hypothetical protein
VLFGDSVDRWFAPQEYMSTSFPALPAEPDPWCITSFTDTWSVGDVEAMVAKAKAEASR